MTDSTDLASLQQSVRLPGKFSLDDNLRCFLFFFLSVLISFKCITIQGKCQVFLNGQL